MPVPTFECFSVSFILSGGKQSFAVSVAVPLPPAPAHPLCPRSPSPAPPSAAVHRDLQLTCPRPGSQPCGRTARPQWQTRCLSEERGRALAVPPQHPPKQAQGEWLRAAQRQPDRPPVRAPLAPSMKTSICELGYFCWGHPMCPTGLVAGGSSQQQHGTDGTGSPNTTGRCCTARELPPLLTKVQAVLTGHHVRLGLCEGLPSWAQ